MDGFLIFLGILFIIESCIGGLSLALFSNIFSGIFTLILITIVISHPGILWVIPTIISAFLAFLLFKFIYQRGIKPTVLFLYNDVIKPIAMFFIVVIKSTSTFLWKYLKIPLTILFWAFIGFMVLVCALSLHYGAS